MEDNLIPEEKILRAAIGCIEKYGLKGATIRRIAEAANVNSAAISYYYRSKDRLIEKAMEISLKNAFDWDDFPVSEGLSVQEQVKRVFLRLVEGARMYPGLTRAHFYEVFSKGEYDSPAVKKINEFLSELVDKIKAGNPGRDEGELRIAIMQAAAAAFLLPSLMPKLFDRFSGYDLTDGDKLESYIQRTAERLL
jgi:AcrR family transcriptional regulator